MLFVCFVFLFATVLEVNQLLHLSSVTLKDEILPYKNHEVIILDYLQNMRSKSEVDIWAHLQRMNIIWMCKRKKIFYSTSEILYCIPEKSEIYFHIGPIVWDPLRLLIKRLWCRTPKAGYFNAAWSHFQTLNFTLKTLKSFQVRGHSVVVLMLQVGRICFSNNAFLTK